VIARAPGRSLCGSAVLIVAFVACGPRARSPSHPPVSASEVARAPASPDSLLALGERVYLRGAFDTARTLWSEALARGRALQDTLVDARALTWLGLAAWRQGDYRAARRLGEEALALKRRMGRDADLFKSYNALGLLAWNQGRLADATQLFGEASDAARASGDSKGIASASGNLALVQTELGQFEEARRGFDSMRVAGRALHDGRIEGNALTNLGMLAVRVGDPAGAVPLLDSARMRYRATGYPTGEQNALGQLGTAYAALGRPHVALAALDSALQLSRREGVRQDEASDLEAMAEIYRDAGDPQRALELYDRAEPINRDLGLAVEAGADLRNEAEIRGELGDLNDAREDATRALEAHRAAASRFEELTDLLLLADLEARSGLERESVGRLAAARALALDLDVRRARAEVALAEARIADRTGAPAAVLRMMRAARADLAAGGYGTEQEALGLEARALARLGRLDSAAAVGRRAVEALERVRGSYGSAELKASYLAGKQGIYGDLVEVLRRLGRTEAAFEVADAARGRALVEGIASSRPDSTISGPTGRALGESDELLRTIGELTGQMGDAEADLPGNTDSTAAAKVRFLAERLTAARRAYEELAVRIREVGTPATALLGTGATRTSSVLSRLADDEALVEYQPTGDSLVLFVGRRSGLRSLAVPLPRAGLAPRVRLARELIAARIGPQKRTLPVLRGLDNLLLRPLRQSGALTGARTLVIVPHGVLAYFPFAALVDSATGRFLVQDYALLVLPSAAALPALRARGGPSLSQATFDIFAPDATDLPGTGVEAATLGRSLPHATVHLGRGEGGKEEHQRSPATRRALASGGLVHIATHGELNPRNPMFSYVETAAGRADDPGDDGRLEVHEILGLRVRSPLVFLSGCETGLGAAWSTGFAPGEDFATLARAFLYAGARNVVATLWRVDDRGAALFAEQFYRRLRADGPADALAEAQRTLLVDPSYAAPYYWAGYTLAGDGQPDLGAKPSRLSVR
jgi:CHAT domain-containing protein/tetratricopeptide (TPR) repeat protein